MKISGITLRLLRLMHGWSANDVAAYLNVSTGLIYLFEQDRRKLSSDKLYKLLQAWGLSVEEVLEFDKQVRSKSNSNCLR